MIHLASRIVGVRTLAIAIACSVALLVLRPAPAKGRVVVTDTVIEILDDVRFIGRDTIATRSLRTLDAIAETFIGNPSIELVEVQASSAARAQACVDYLVGQGVEPHRLVTGVVDGNRAAFLIVRRASDPDASPGFAGARSNADALRRSIDSQP